MDVCLSDRPQFAMAPKRGEKLAVRPAWFTAEEDGPVSILAVWEAAYEEPLYLVTTRSNLEAALGLYRQRAHLETCFSDQQSRSLHLHKRHLCAPIRLTRLLIAAGVA
ncbi:MAG: hypothetical protein M3380_20505 [Chloroflexota bacterium]|nr:hypothetical protein [Chloroflexota bacterium]